MNKDTFDRSVCFTYFNEYHKQVMLVNKLFGAEKAMAVYEAIADYGLFGKEPEDEEVLLLTGASVLKSIDLSQDRRQRGFAGEDLDKSELIITMHIEHPEYSQNRLAEMLHTSKGKINKTLKRFENGYYDNIFDFTGKIQILDTKAD